MAKIKEFMKFALANLWETLKGSFMLILFYGMLRSSCVMGSFLNDWTGPVSEGLNGKRVALVVIIALVAAAYNAFYCFAIGGKGYEMLVSGNMKRLSAQELGSSYKISSHKELQEYRAWKGFAMGACVGVFTILFGILMGANGSEVNKALQLLGAGAEKPQITVKTGASVLLLFSMLFCGWSLIPFAFANLAGASASYFFSCFFALIPIVVSGVFYIMGAYSKRSKSLKAQEEADRAALAQEAKPKKINYGGLPGTKPKKKK